MAERVGFQDITFLQHDALNVQMFQPRFFLHTCKLLCQLPHASNLRHSRFVSGKEKDDLSENEPRSVLLWAYDESR